MQISEIFVSKQGEGQWTGTVSTFVRFFGCHLQCRYCDSDYAWKNTESPQHFTWQQVADAVVKADVKHVVLTGGEPMLHPELAVLSQFLVAKRFIVTLETSGTIDNDNDNDNIECHLLSVSPKLSNAGLTDTWPNLDVLRRLLARYSGRNGVDDHSYQVKFAVENEGDLVEIESFLQTAKVIVPDRVFLMPQATDVVSMRQIETWLQPYCEKKRYTYCPRMQLVWYDGQRGK